MHISRFVLGPLRALFDDLSGIIASSSILILIHLLEFQIRKVKQACYIQEGGLPSPATVRPLHANSDHNPPSRHEKAVWPKPSRVRKPNLDPRTSKLFILRRRSGTKACLVGAPFTASI